MKNKMLKALVLVLSLMLMLVAFAGCNQAGIQGPAGPQGEQGEPGINGENGIDGKSAYELAVEKGYNGTVEEWLASLVGEAGVAGENGANGQSAYEIAVKNGYTGSETEWLASLVGVAGTNGNNGSNGKSAYELACENGFTGSLSEWLDSLVGKDGVDGNDGINGKSAYELACENGFNGTLTEWLASLVGKDGIAAEKGEDGEDGKSAYELAVENGFKGDLQTWLASLVGSNGENGKSAYEIAVDNGYKGTEKEWLATLVGAKGEKGDPGADGVGIRSIALLNTNKNVDTYQITYTNGETTTFSVTNGVDGANGNDGIGINDAVINAEGELVLSLSNGNSLNLGTVVGSKCETGEACKDGADGVGIANVALNGNNLVITLTNGTVIDLGNVKGADGKDGTSGSDGKDGISVIKSEINANDELVLYYSNNTSTNLGKVVGSNGTNGADGVGIQTVKVDENGNLSVTLTTGVTLNLGNIKGPQGDKGDNGIDGVSVVDAEINNDGELIFTLSNGEKINVGKIIGSNGINGSNGTNGVDGVGIKGIAFNANGELIITLTDNSTINCGKVPPCNHSYSSWSTVSEANCTSMGVKVRTCSKCGFEDYDFVSSLGHNYKNTVVSATCTEKGYTLHECNKCDYEYRDTYTTKVAHSYGNWSEMLSTCTTKVLCQSCTVCGSSAIKSESGSWHNYTTSVVTSTCSEQGYTLHSCSNCGNSYKDTYVEKVEHQYEDLYTIESNCTHLYVLQSCIECGNLKKAIKDPIMYHEYSNDVCIHCGQTCPTDAWDGTIATSFGGGDGSEESPYLIYTAEELAYLANVINGSDYANYNTKHYLLMNHIDLSSHSWTPIGNGSSRKFSGTFDGRGNKILNVTLLDDHNGYIGLFGYTVDAEVSNINVDIILNISEVQQSYPYIGCIGRVDTSKLSNIFVDIAGTAQFSRDGYVGALTGFMYDSIADNCISNVNLVLNTNYVSSSIYFSARAYFGGLVGALRSSTLSNSHSEGSINATLYQSACGSSMYGGIQLGGLIGNIEEGSSTNVSVITKCYAMVDVVGYAENTQAYVGGFYGFADVGENSSNDTTSATSIENCYCTGYVEAKTDRPATTGSVWGPAAGGFLGYDFGNVKINNCYSTGDVVCIDKYEDDISIGGFAGYLRYGIIRNCFATGNITAEVAIRDSYWMPTHFDRFVGYLWGAKFENCYTFEEQVGTSNNEYVILNNYDSYKAVEGLDMISLASLNHTTFWEALGWDTGIWYFTDADDVVPVLR